MNQVCFSKNANLHIHFNASFIQLSKNNFVQLKKYITFSFFLFVFSYGFSQTDTIKISRTDTSFYSEIEKRSSENTVTSDKIENKDVRSHKKHDHFNWEDDFRWKKFRKTGFNGHWNGFELGINSLMNKNQSYELEASDKYMTLNTNRSLNFNLNVFERNASIVSDRLGLVSGLGIEWYNYFFANKNSIAIDSIGNVSEKFISNNVKKSKLTAMYLSIPLMLEFNFSGNQPQYQRFHISVGIIGSMKVNSHTKVVHYSNGNEIKEKDWKSFNLTVFRYGYIAKMGFGHLSVYASYYPTPLFRKNLGPELYPFNVGIALN